MKTKITEDEPAEAFPYTPPTDELISKYKAIFALQEPIPVPFPKLLFDKMLAGFFFVLTLPALLFLWVFNLVEGVLIPENRGQLFFYYNGVSHGRVFKKWKIRQFL